MIEKFQSNGSICEVSSDIPKLYAIGFGTQNI